MGYNSSHSVWLIFMAQKLGPHIVQYLPNTSHSHSNVGINRSLEIDLFRTGIGNFQICLHTI